MLQNAFSECHNNHLVVGVSGWLGGWVVGWLGWPELKSVSGAAANQLPDCSRNSAADAAPFFPIYK